MSMRFTGRAGRALAAMLALATGIGDATPAHALGAYASFGPSVPARAVPGEGGTAADAGAQSVVYFPPTQQHRIHQSILLRRQPAARPVPQPIGCHAANAEPSGSRCVR